MEPNWIDRGIQFTEIIKWPFVALWLVEGVNEVLKAIARWINFQIQLKQ